MEVFVLIAIGFAGAFISGLLGIGGAVLLIPLLLYVPPLLGLPAFGIGPVTGMSIVQVLAASAFGLVLHGRKGFFSARVGVPMAIAAGVGALVGGLATGWLSPSALQALFAALALAAAALMVLPDAPGSDYSQAVPEGYNDALAGALAGAVGVVSGLLGAGGAFLLVPLMRTLLRLPLRLIIGTSLAIVLVSASAGMLGKAVTGQIPWLPAGWLVLGSLLGTPLGAWVSHRTPVKTLRWVLAGLIALVGIRMMAQVAGLAG